MEKEIKPESEGGEEEGGGNQRPRRMVDREIAASCEDPNALCYTRSG